MRKKSSRTPRNCFWHGGVLWGRKKIKGRDHKWSLRTTDAAVAQARVAAEIERLITRAIYGDGWTVWGDAVVQWHDNYIVDRQINDSTMTRYMTSLRQLEPWLLNRYVDGRADYAVGGIDAQLIAEIVAARRKTGVTTATLRRDLGAMASVLTACQLAGLRTNNPAFDRLRLLKERRNPIVLPDPAHVERVISRAPGLLASLIRLAWATGCRQAELVGALRQHVDHERRELTVIGKGNKLRVVDLAPFGGYEIARTIPSHVRKPWLFWHHGGEPYRNVASRFANLVGSIFAAAYDAVHGTDVQSRLPLTELYAAQTWPGWTEIGFRPFRFHDLRHLHAVEWLRSGRSLYDLQIRLGHESITTTEGYLKYLTPEEQRAVKFGASGEQKGEPSARIRVEK